MKNVFTIEARLGFESTLSHLISKVIHPFKYQGNRREYSLKVFPGVPEVTHQNINL